MSLLMRHALLILAWATIDVVIVGALWRYGRSQERRLATRLRHLDRLGRALDAGEVVSLAEFKYSRPSGRRRRRRA